MKDSKIGGAYGKYGTEGKCWQGYDEGSSKKIVTSKTCAWMRAVCNTEMILNLLKPSGLFTYHNV